MNKIIAVTNKNDIFPVYRDTPIERLFAYHNLGNPFPAYTKAELLVGMCMDNRKHLHIPDNFAFIIRTGGGNLRFSAFKVAYAIAIGGVQAIALIGHNDCGMVNLMAKKQRFIEGMARCGWEASRAEEHFMQFAPVFEIGNEIEFVVSEAARLRTVYKNMLIAPLFYKVDDNQLYLIDEN